MSGAKQSSGPSGSLGQAIAVVWFKVTDLRTHDHEPLLAAHASGLPVLHLFVFDPRWQKCTPLCGFPRLGPLRAKFQLEALHDLAGRLEAGGHFLSIRRGLSTAAVFKELCNDFCVSAVFASREVCPEELKVESQVQAVLGKHGAGRLRLFWTFELHHYDDLPEELQQYGSNSYTGYKDAFHSRCDPRKPLPSPDLRCSSPGVKWKRSQTLPDHVGELGLAPPDPPPDWVQQELYWQGGETAALARVEQYIFETDALALDYVGSTNTPREGNSCTKKGAMSRLSPWLAHGCLSARLLYAEIKRYERERHKSGSTYWLVHELYWRDFVRFSSLIHGSKIFKVTGIYNRHPSWKWSGDGLLLQDWIDGNTGFPFLDAAMREIKFTGYSCHVGRETAAWFLICDLGLDWRMGAEWFESVLIDYEPAANWFCWAFICLVRATGGNGFRDIGHPVLAPGTRLQTVEVVFLSAQHDPDGQYIQQWVPELQGLSGLLTREPWRATADPVPATGNGRNSRPSSPQPGPERIQMARRTLTKGGAQVAVWWGCTRTARGVRGWPSGYSLPLFPPASFFDIEKVADSARRKQTMKAGRVARLRDQLGHPKLSNGAPCAKDRDLDRVVTVCLEATSEPVPRRRRRWGYRPVPGDADVMCDSRAMGM